MAEANGSIHPVAKKEFIPRLIFWEVTKGCNLRCIHCRATATELMSPRDLPTGKALNIISQIADFGSPILVLSGGEPLYRRDIFELAEYATSRGLRHGSGDQRHASDERSCGEDPRTPASRGYRFRWMVPIR